MADTTRTCWVILNDRVWVARVIARYPQRGKTKLHLIGAQSAEMVEDQHVDMFPSRIEALLSLQSRIESHIRYYLSARERIATELRNEGVE